MLQADWFSTKQSFSLGSFTTNLPKLPNSTDLRPPRPPSRSSWALPTPRAHQRAERSPEIHRPHPPPSWGFWLFGFFLGRFGGALPPSLLRSLLAKTGSGGFWLLGLRVRLGECVSFETLGGKGLAVGCLAVGLGEAFQQLWEGVVLQLLDVVGGSFWRWWFWRGAPKSYQKKTFWGGDFGCCLRECYLLSVMLYRGCQNP